MWIYLIVVVVAVVMVMWMVMVMAMVMAWGGAVGGRTADGGGLNKRFRRRVTQPYCSWGGRG